MCISCGGLFENNTTTSSSDTGVAESIDTEVGTEYATGCKRACSGFQFSTCEREVMKALPVGVHLVKGDCIGKCEELAEIYQFLPDERLDFPCLEVAVSCPAVASCFGIGE